MSWKLAVRKAGHTVGKFGIQISNWNNCSKFFNCKQTAQRHIQTSAPNLCRKRFSPTLRWPLRRLVQIEFVELIELFASQLIKQANKWSLWSKSFCIVIELCICGFSFGSVIFCWIFHRTFFSALNDERRTTRRTSENEEDQIVVLARYGLDSNELVGRLLSSGLINCTGIDPKYSQGTGTAYWSHLTEWTVACMLPTSWRQANEESLY